MHIDLSKKLTISLEELSKFARNDRVKKMIINGKTYEAIRSVKMQKNEIQVEK